MLLPRRRALVLLSSRRFISSGPPPPSPPRPPPPPPPSDERLEEGSSPPPVLPHRVPPSYVPSPPSTTLLNVLPTFFRPPAPPSDLQTPNAVNAFSSGPHEDASLPILFARDQGNDGNYSRHARQELIQFLLKSSSLLLAFLTASYTAYLAKSAWAELWGMRAPSAMFEPAASGEEEEQEEWGARRVGGYGWELENDQNWTGGLKGGTDAYGQLEMIKARQQLRQAWEDKQLVEEMEYDKQRKVDSSTSTPTTTTTTTTTSSSSSSASSSSNSTTPQGSLSSVDSEPNVLDSTLDSTYSFLLKELRLDPLQVSKVTEGGAAASELYLAQAISYALKQSPRSVRFPPSISSSSNDALALPLPSPVVGARSGRRRPRIREHEAGQAITLRHAEAWEDLGTEESLAKAKGAYEGVLRDVVGVRGAETLEGRLAERVGRLEALVGGEEGGKRGEEWIVWGIARVCGWDGTGARAGRRRRLVGGGGGGGGENDASNSEENKSIASRIASYLPSWSTFTTNTNTTDHSSSSQPVALLSILPPLPTLLSSLDPSTLPPARLRTLLSLLLTLSSLQSKPNSLPEAHQTQLAIQTFLARSLPPSAHDLLDPEIPDPMLSIQGGGFNTSFADFKQRFTKRRALSVSLKAKKEQEQEQDAFEKGKRAAAERLHVLSLLLSQAVVDGHEAEVRFAMRKKGGKAKEEVERVEKEVLESVQRSLLRSSKILCLLTMRPKKKKEGKKVLPEWLPIPPPKVVLPTEPGDQFTSYSILAHPAQRLVDSAARASASAANLLGLLAMAGLGVDAFSKKRPTDPLPANPIDNKPLVSLPPPPPPSSSSSPPKPSSSSISDQLTETD
ncbi:hypothetical protein BDY24DRAFT_434121, partial [Mrakia frigida]|uniref:uncharacterized protein n=1 Tax=Mrakia frigida TaxID=29902 RepID=UPI003FCC230A